MMKRLNKGLGVLLLSAKVGTYAERNQGQPRQISGQENFVMKVSGEGINTHISPNPMVLFGKTNQITISGEWIQNTNQLYALEVYTEHSDEMYELYCYPGEDRVSDECVRPKSTGEQWATGALMLPSLLTTYDSEKVTVKALTSYSETLWEIEVDTRVSFGSYAHFIEEWVSLIANALLYLSALLAIIVTSAYNCEGFTIGSLLILLLSSSVMISTSISTILNSAADITSVVVYNSLSSIAFAWFHNLFSWQYLRASFLVPLNLSDAPKSSHERARVEKKTSRIVCWTNFAKIAPAAILPALLIIILTQYGGYEDTNYVLIFNSISITLNFLSTCVLLVALIRIKRFVTQMRRWRWSKDGLFVIHILLFSLLLLTEIVQISHTSPYSEYRDRGYLISMVYNLINCTSAIFIVFLFVKFSKAKWSGNIHRSTIAQPSRPKRISISLNELDDEPRGGSRKQNSRKMSLPDIDIEIAFQFCDAAKDLAEEGAPQVSNSLDIKTSASALLVNPADASSLYDRENLLPASDFSHT